MRDMVGCFSEHAIRLSETTCSSQINHHRHQHQSPIISHHHQHHLITPSTPATQITVTSQYNITTLSRHLIVIVTLTWSRNQIGHQSLTITFNDNKNPSSSTTSFKLTTTNATRLFRKKKGTKSIELNNSTTKIELLWDLTEANYDSYSGGVEPVSGFYLIVLVNSEIGLMLGDLCGEVSNKKLLKSIAGSSSSSSSSMLSKWALVSRKEYYSGESLLYMTKTKFSECGEMHEISIWCVGEDEGLKYPVLCVSVDGRVVVRVKRLKWNFRGNSTVFVDGLLIDLFWDVHGWFFGNSGGSGVFMFRKRCGIESRLWLHQEEEKVKLSEVEMMQLQDGDGGEQFSLLVYGSKIVG